jgi:hypothetical protein
MTELQAPKGVSDEELRDTILKLAAEGALRVTSNSALFSNEAEVHHYVADKLRDNPDFRIKTEVCRGDYEKWAAKPEFSGAFSVDLIIWNRGAKVEDDQVRAIVEFKLTAADSRAKMSMVASIVCSQRTHCTGAVFADQDPKAPALLPGLMLRPIRSAGLPTDRTPGLLHARRTKSTMCRMLRCTVDVRIGSIAPDEAGAGMSARPQKAGVSPWQRTGAPGHKETPRPFKLASRAHATSHCDRLAPYRRSA